MAEPWGGATPKTLLFTAPQPLGTRKHCYLLVRSHFGLQLAQNGCSGPPSKPPASSKWLLRPAFEATGRSKSLLRHAFEASWRSKLRLKHAFAAIRRSKSRLKHCCEATGHLKTLLEHSLEASLHPNQHIPWQPLSVLNRPPGTPKSLCAHSHNSKSQFKISSLASTILRFTCSDLHSSVHGYAWVHTSVYICIYIYIFSDPLGSELAGD